MQQVLLDVEGPVLEDDMAEERDPRDHNSVALRSALPVGKFEPKIGRTSFQKVLGNSGREGTEEGADGGRRGER